MYKLTLAGSIFRKSDGAYIPVDEANTDYQQYLLDVENGAEVEPADLPDPKEEIKAEIVRIEQETMVPRVVRESLLTFAEVLAAQQAAKLGVPVDALLAQNIAYVRAKAIDDQIKTLREQLA